ncbi:MAG TPA: phospholipase D-like domain-containing protein [Thermoanaerobaculia bacterium]|nr:phospholipase D-like domain-containing protein [Thermoanaerobaculia bacterium]
MRLRNLLALLVVVSLSLLATLPALAQSQFPGEELCDPGVQDCRQLLWSRIDAETVEIDVAFWFMFDTSLSGKLIDAKRRGVKVRVLVDNDASNTYPANQPILDQLASNGIPMRDYKATDGIQHWKMMLFAGQGVVEFSAANYGGDDFVGSDPYRNYIAEAIFFCKTPSVLDSFKTRFDDLWMDDNLYGDYANIVRPLTRSYPVVAFDPELNFVPIQNYQNRLLPLINGEQQQIDAIMYRFTVREIADALIAAKNRGVPVRLITEQDQYRNSTFRWDAYNVDRIHKAGIPVKFRAHQGLMHQKSIILYGQNVTAFGSSNWDEGAVAVHQEHNYFTSRAWIKDWFVNQFNRRWSSNNPVGAVEYAPFVPLPPDAPVNIAPANGATGQPTSVTLTWEGGLWAHRYDIYLGTNPNSLPLLAAGVNTGSIEDGVNETYGVSVAAGTTYYWRIVGRTMADQTANGPTWSFTTGGSGSPAPTVTAISPGSGSTSGGTAVTITGSSFQAGATVTIGGAAATGVNVASGSAITATTPAHAAGAADVVVRNPDNQTGTLPGGFTYGAPPAAGEIVLYASEAGVRVGNWSVAADGTAAGGSRIANADAGAAKIVTPRANPADYFQITFNANAGTAYHLWMRGRAQNDSPFNDSVHLQFSDSVDASDTPHWRIGSTESQEYNLEDCLGCTVQGWGWQDNAWPTGATAQLIYFQTSGSHTVRVQVREDGLSLDQIVLSPTTYFSSSPGALRNDATILPKSGGPAAAPTVSAIAPNSGSTNGGTSVTITGTNFVSGATVTLGGTAATGVNVMSATSITATTPAHAAGAVNVVVRNPDAQTGTLPSGFTYTAPSGLPSPWLSTDVGGPAPAGSASHASGVFTLNGGGADIYGTTDTFRYVYRPMPGDGEIIARIDSLTNTSDEFAVAGVMIRKDIADAASPEVSMLVTPSFSGRAKFRYRETANGITTSLGPGPGSITLPQWVRLVRTGTRVDAYRSDTGSGNWTLTGTINIDFGANAQVGLVVNSHNTSSLATATISNVSP